MDLLVTLPEPTPGPGLTAAAAVVDALAVPVTLLVGPTPHPEVAAWVADRRRAGDAVLLHGTRPRPVGRRPYRRLPAHEAGLRLVGALRSIEVRGVAVDGFSVPGGACSAGTREATARSGLDLLLDADGLHRLDPVGRPVASSTGPGLRHVRLDPAAGAGRARAEIDSARAAGARPAAAPALLAPGRAARPAAPVDPELWSITA